MKRYEYIKDDDGTFFVNEYEETNEIITRDTIAEGLSEDEAKAFLDRIDIQN